MADIYISNLPAQSGNTTPLTDVVAKDDGTTTKKLSISQIAKTVIENFTGSSLAGSAQSIKSAVDSVYNLIKNIAPETTKTFNSLDDIPLSQFGYCTLNNASDYPSAGVNTIGYFKFGISNRVVLFGVRTGGTFPEFYVNVNHGGVWRGWKALAEYSLIEISNSVTYNIESNSRVVIDVIGSVNGAKGTIYAYSTNAGVVSFEKVGLSGATITTGTNTLTVSGINAQTFARVYKGNIS